MNFIITPANVDDRNAVYDLSESYNSIYVIGDKGYVGKTLKPDFKSEKNIDLIFLKRNNDKYQYLKETRQMIFKIRRRI